MNRQLIIDQHVINDDSDCFVIAEIGHNHQGSLQKAIELFHKARECGAQAVKLQKRDNRTLYSKAQFDAPYDNENSFGLTYGAHREALEFGREEYVALQQTARELGLIMFATAFDFNSADFLAELDMPVYKIASGDVKNTPLLQHVARIGKPIIVSTGGATLDDVQRIYDTVMPINPQLVLLQCTAAYPANAEDLHLRVITTYRAMFPDIVIGLSDHQNGISMALVAYTLGARIIEKHFTSNRALKGTDHAFSLEPIGLQKLVRDLERARMAMGDSEKKPQPCEERAVLKMGKTLVAARDLPAGHRVAREDIAMKSPGGGMPPYALDRVIGLILERPLAEDDAFTYDDLKVGV